MINGTTLGDYFDQLKRHYKGTSTLRIPFAYSQNAGSFDGLIDEAYPTWNGSNVRKKQTIESTKTTFDVVGGEARQYKLGFKLFLYDMFYGTLPWNLGINRGAFVFEDAIVMNGAFQMEESAGGELTILENDFVFSFYNLTTGKLEVEKTVTVHPATASLDSYWLDLSIYEGDYSGSDKFFELDDFRSLEVTKLKVATFSIPNNPLSYTSEIWESESPTDWMPQRRDTTVYQSPIFRLNYVSALDTGSWSNYPLGSSSMEITARNLSIPYNNKYATTQTGAGVIQILEMVEADMLEAYSANIANAGINFSDIRSLYQAVQGYLGVMAANICSQLKLPRVFNGVYQAALEYYFFMYETWPPTMSAAIDEALNYVREDYSLADNVSQLKTYLTLYWHYMGAYGTYFSSTGGENVKRLGVAAASAQTVLDMYIATQESILWVAWEKAANIVMSQARIQGSFDLLDKSFTPQPGVAMQAYIGHSNMNIIVTGYNMTLDTAGNFRTTVNYVKGMF